MWSKLAKLAKLGLLVGCGGCSAAAAQAPGASALEPVFACAGLADPAERLSCFDTAVGELRGADSRGEISVLGLQDLRRLDEEAFGFSVPSLERLIAKPATEPSGDVQAEGLKRITSNLKAWRLSANGKARFTLANGQIWDQIDNGRILAKPGAEVSIKRAALGSFLLSVGGRTYRVRREQ